MAYKHSLEALLENGLQRDPRVAVGKWRPDPSLADLPPDLKQLSAPSHDRFIPAPLGLIDRLAPGAVARHARAVEAGEADLAAATAAWTRQGERQAAALKALKAKVDAHNRGLEEIETKLKAGDPDTVRWYAARVLEASPYPDDLHRKIEVAPGQTARSLRVSLTIADAKALAPTIERYKFNKTHGDVHIIKRSPEEIDALYERVTAQLALRSLDEVFRSDIADAIDVIFLRLAAETADPGTGRTVIAPLLSVGVARAEFSNIDLSRVDPIACLERLKKLPVSSG